MRIRKSICNFVASKKWEKGNLPATLMLSRLQYYYHTMKKHLSLLSILLAACVVSVWADIDMQAHVASDEGRAAYTSYVSKQSSYYTGNYTFAQMIEQTGNTLFGTINTLMGNTCQNGSGFSYDKLKNNFVSVDRDLNKSSNIIGYYDGSSMNGTWDSGSTWNREHTWPQSKFKGSNSSGTSLPIGYDMQSVRPASTKVNSSRGNSAYGESSGYYDPNEISINNSAYKSVNNGTYRGDCARVILYDYVVYGKWGSYYNDLYKSTVDADLLTQIGTNSNSVFESLSILLKWHMQDPPSLTEMVRNDGGQDYQGNRNVFIDYPELAINMLKDQSGVTAYNVSYDMASSVTASPAYIYTTPAGFVCYLTNTSGSHPSSVSVSGAASSYEASLGRLTVSNVTKNMTITVDGGATIAPFTVTLSRNGETTKVYNQTAAYTLPASGEADACDGWNFAGWSETEVSSTSAQPTFITTVSETKTVYAVYMQTTSTGSGSSTASITFGEQNYGNPTEMTTVTLDNSILTFDKGSNNNTPKYYSSGTAVRMYGGNTLTVTGTGISSIELTFGSGDSSNEITTNVGTYSSGSWSGNADEVVFTIGGTSGNRRIASISVTASGGSTTYTYSTEPDCNIALVDPTASFDESEVSVVLGGTVSNAFTTNSTGAVTYSSSNTAVATVDASTGEVTIKSAGTTTITASVAATNRYNAATASYILTITEPAKYNVTWSVAGEQSVVEYTEGDDLVLPAAPADCSEDVVFVGWTADGAFSEGDTAPADLFTTAEGNTVTADITYFAVFATTSTASSGSGSAAAAGTTLWAEDFSSFSANDVPDAAGENTVVYGDATVTYSCENGGGATKIYDAALAGGTTPEILIAKSDGSFTALGLPTGGASVMTLSFKTNKTSGLTVTSATSGINIGSLTVSNGTATCDITNSGNVETFSLTITFTQTSNSREDDFLLTVKTAGVSQGSSSVTIYSGYTLTCPAEPTCTLSGITLNTDAVDKEYNVGDAFSAEGIVVTANYSGDGCQDAVVTNWTASDPDMTTAGSKTITITYSEEGVEVTATYDITVSEKQQGSGEQTATFVFNTDDGLAALGIAKPATSQDTPLGAEVYSAGAISLTTTDGSTATRVYNSNGTLDLRIYKNATLTFSGATITKVEISGSSLGSFSAAVGTYANGTWEGETTALVLTASATVKVNTITVTYSGGTDIEKYAINISQVDNATISVEGNLTEAIEGKTITLAIETASGWDLDYFTVNGDPVVGNTFTMPAEDVTVSAVLKEHVVVLYNISIDSKIKNGVIETLAAGSAVSSAEAGTEITVFDTPANGYMLTSITVADANGNPVNVENSVFVMPASNVTVSATFGKQKTYVIANWGEFDDNDEVIITMTLGDGSTYALYSDNGTAKAPAAVAVEVEDYSTIVTAENNIYWNLVADPDNNAQFSIHLPGSAEKWLYTTDTNNGARVGTNTDNLWTIDATSGYLQHVATSRYLGVYNKSDWRTYKSTSTNIADQTLGFFVREIAGSDIATSAEEVSGEQFLQVVGNTLLNLSDSEVGVYNIAGQCVATVKDRLNLNMLPAGIYIVTNGTTAIKLLTR